MPMFVQCWSFQKRPNSTKQPFPGDPNMLQLNNVELKEETSVLSPTLKLSPKIDGLSVGPTLFNYVCIPQWQRYYYVREWRYVGNAWEIDLAVDVLASFREMIGDTEAYILRSSALYDGDIIDTQYPTKPDIDFVNVPVACSWYNVAPSGGCYVVGLINYQSSNKVGATAYYALTPSQFSSVLAWLFGDTIANSQVNIDQNLFKAIFNPLQYFTSCTWFPFTIDAFGSTQTDVKAGYWSTGVNGIMVSALAQKTFITATIPNHPQLSRGSYLNRSPYTRLSLYIPPFGCIPIDTNCLSNGHYLYSAVLIDHITGQATIRISTCQDALHLNEYNIITERTGTIGVPIQLAQVLTDTMNTLTTVGGAAGALFTGNILGAVANITSAIESQMPKVSTSGSNGSFCSFIQQPILTAEYYLLPEENNAEYGRPLCKEMKISSIPGYIKCGESDHQFPGTQGERDEINKFLSDGFFYE